MVSLFLSTIKMVLNAKIHATAIVENTVIVGQNVEIGPYCVLSGNVFIGDNTKIRGHVAIDGNVKIGSDCDIFPFASIGFGPQGYEQKHPDSQLIIGNKNIIREGVTISGGSPKDNLVTKIGNNCLFMAYSHVAHDCILGDNIILANNVALAGHVIIENNAIIGGNSAIHQFVKIGQFAMIGGMSGLTKDILPFTMYISHHQSEDLSMHSGIMGVNIIGLKRAKMSRNDILELVAFYNNFLNHPENTTEKSLSLLQKYNKYQHLITNKNNKSAIKNFIDIKSHQGFYREMLKVRHLH